jgi:hypothetical protein
VLGGGQEQVVEARVLRGEAKSHEGSVVVARTSG